MNARTFGMFFIVFILSTSSLTLGCLSKIPVHGSVNKPIDTGLCEWLKSFSKWLLTLCNSYLMHRLFQNLTLQSEIPLSKTKRTFANFMRCWGACDAAGMLLAHYPPITQALLILHPQCKPPVRSYAWIPGKGSLYFCFSWLLPVHDLQPKWPFPNTQFLFHWLPIFYQNL